MSASSVVCRQLVEMVTDYLEHALTPARRAAVEAHLLACDDCTAYVEQMRTLIRLQSAVTGVPPTEADLPAGMLDGLLSAFRNHHETTRG